MPAITALLPQPRRKDQIAVYLDGEFAFVLARTVVQDARLSIGQPISPSDRSGLETQQTFHSVLQTAYRVLSYGPRSESELRTRLRRRGAPTATIDAVLAKLKEQRLLDDVAFAADFAERRTAANPRSSRMVSWELRRKGVAPETVEDAVAGLDDEATAYRAAAKRASRLPDMDHNAFRQKLGGFLQRRGFAYGVAAKVVERVWQERPANDTNEPIDE